MNWRKTFEALTDSIIPAGRSVDVPSASRQPEAKETFSSLPVEDYIISSLDHPLSIAVFGKTINIGLAKPTAKMLDIAARKLVGTKRNLSALQPGRLPRRGAFAVLSSIDRLGAMVLLEEKADFVRPSPAS